MQKKLTLAQITERLIYLLAIILVPSIPLFYLYGRNAALGLLFRHFLIMGGGLAVISLVIYLLVSKLFLRRRRTVVIIALFWSAFWFFHPIGKIIARGDNEFSERKIAIYLLVFIISLTFFLRNINMSRFVVNTTAVILCLLFAFNFVPQALTVTASERQRASNEKTGKMPYKIKTEFSVDTNLPKPNVYWLHMDGMMGFDAVERYFNDPQTELKNNLTQHGFVINKSARFDAGSTLLGIPSLTCPVFYDSYLANEYARFAHLTAIPRENSILLSIIEKGFSLNDIYQKIEILNAFSDAEYVNFGNDYITKSNNIDMWVDGINVITWSREAANTFNILSEFKELITDASALSVIKPRIDEILEKKRPVANTQPIPVYQETVDKYVTSSDSDDGMAYVVKVMKYVASLQMPHFVYFINGRAHIGGFGTGKTIGGVTYEEPLGRAFYLDENGNYYKERLDDPNDIHLYLPQHKYAVKEMMAQIDTIIENDPDAVIIIQADHGIHGSGTGADFYDSKFMFERGYSLEDQQNLSFHVISAVRIPSQYGKLSQPLDPLDIARYLVNNFVGKGNYDYLYYKEENPQ